eukprot:TRINITY_DN26412_c0_g1_i1.p1 TRINITY_DN26412_c0_g1~~TRINITY_DN26412_c0_g1_i1.p1  ORF type:complete len:162 (+),score=29.97 TRINITY_DN26412_c0_g1_i1:103-588(+)
MAPIFGRFTTLPVTLYRLQPKLPVALRNLAEQQALKRAAWDIKVHSDGLVHPAVGDEFIGPNGMSLRPKGSQALAVVMMAWKGPKPAIYALPQGLVLPERLVCLHEHTDHYAMQPAKAMTLDELNSALTELLQSVQTITEEELMKDYQHNGDFVDAEDMPH